MKSNSGKFDYREHYRRRLPHYQPPGATLFVTLRLAGSLPATYLERLRLEAETERLALEQQLNSIEDETERRRQLDLQYRREFGRWDEALDQVVDGPTWLADPAIAEIVAASLQHMNNVRYVLDAYCIMPNHIHVLMRPLPKEDGTYHALARITHSLKSFTANSANRKLGRKGSFWQHESYDHVVRDEGEWERIVRYVLQNPVKAGLVTRATDWAWSYYRGER